MRTTRVKSMALGLLFVFTFLSADIAYGLGGGGHRGDGRWDVPQPAAPANGNSSNSQVQQNPSGPVNPSAAPQQTSTWTLYSGFGDECAMGLVTVPEPTALLLLGLGVIGLVSVRRKFGK